MDLINFVNKKYRTKTVAEILTKGNTDGEEGLSKNEVHALIEDGHNKKSIIFNTVKFFWGTDNMTNSVFKALDKDNNKIITLEECDLFAQEKCNITLKDIWNKTAEEVCYIIDNSPNK